MYLQYALNLEQYDIAKQLRDKLNEVNFTSLLLPSSWIANKDVTTLQHLIMEFNTVKASSLASVPDSCRLQPLQQ